MPREALFSRYLSVRSDSTELCAPLEIEDYVVQTMEDVSPAKWHLAHCTWFFERVVLQSFLPNYQPFNPDYYALFNSYYGSFELPWARSRRGVLARPTVSEVFEYRKIIDQRVQRFLASCSEGTFEEVSTLIELGLQHEKQHQELFLTDIKHVFASNPLRPAYRSPDEEPDPTLNAAPLRYLALDAGLTDIGATAESFAWDNERPRHRVYLDGAQIALRPVSCGEYLAFIEDGGYENELLWLSDGWAMVQREQLTAPLYWRSQADTWILSTLFGDQTLRRAEPVCHVSYFEADAYARWAGCRLPTEFEWEQAAQLLSHGSGCSCDTRGPTFHPAMCTEDALSGTAPCKTFGEVWEWTASAYLPYPRYTRERGPLGEYNGKFMNGQYVLRGGSCASPTDHIRSTYRNFFQPEKRWQFSGIRLAKDS